MKSTFPNRIVCLTDEVTEWLYLLEEQHRIVGISAFAERPIEAKKEKPMVCGFTGANYKKILATNPDLIIGFSDLQADIASRLIKEGIPTIITNQRSIDEILSTLLMVARIVGAEEKGLALITKMEQEIESAKQFSKSLKIKPKVYFEEWDEPLISGIKWVSELIKIAGGIDVFDNLSNSHSASGRIIKSFDQVVDLNPDIGLFCWCGKKFKKEQLLSRKNVNKISFYSSNEIHEIDPLYILQPGPASIMEGLPHLRKIIENWSNTSIVD
ncbi:ABC transporter substrate-binding protein [Flammeovirga kamogawensis]|uniref:ABC transporter substrate-binding protein n=1 Tax=Flammeovirga kamogawensis TaxID=373891 RepID=A0ABX8GX01_9BACT|nr:ABC transporter substrate-binding protein [Flammeovirga kamogawensis]MBB6461296.1 iron complex transport system substrate-binding protein [Flammeovirga kamogawensis]QWG07853.1 ABC transporter substrate-binding protein [Flammeovirga kamogawensis]TRX69660.1 ABC transporter substrate-binding protein [Flammeovirga kamogawensis]